MDVLYSLLDIENQQLNMIVKDQKFTTSLNFVLTMITNNVLLIDDCKLDRFCINTLSKIALNIKSLIVESESMERILLAADYPNLVVLKFFNFNNKTASKYFTGQRLDLLKIIKEIDKVGHAGDDRRHSETIRSCLILNDLREKHKTT
ncbi:unnamed protein product [Rotaria sordida]|uniref:Uncharacterized protein n=1 Tax=Rotaria sordida TaxID=392033 RepID=A0A815TU86_9BILA|nr:unnamed protein product [Rotaria sordida]CAF3531411.1 unnamed protein product [Rotaria sordida]CAF3656477.1 unnamed protein product [Rotaria sordida]CAF3986538.1 unnamed protein product [Rotaria sordida]